MNEERNKVLAVSRSTLLQFQNEWDSTKPYADFVAAQNDEFRKCLELECAEIGQIVRTELGLPTFPEDLYQRALAVMGDE